MIKQNEFFGNITQRNHNLVNIATLYCDPIEFAVSNVFPLFGGLLILKSRMHICTLGAWGMYRFIYASEEHSGYDFPWHLNKIIPLGIDAKHHDFHHSKNSGNYGEFTRIWDIIFGTEVTYAELKKANSKIKN